MSAQDREGTSWWPSTDSSIEPSGVVVVTVNYNTKRLVSMLRWSLYRFLGSELRSVVVVDNGSSDGSTEILQACARTGLCELIPTARTATTARESARRCLIALRALPTLMAIVRGFGCWIRTAWWHDQMRRPRQFRLPELQALRSSARPRGTGGTRTSGCADTRSSSIPTALGNLRLDLLAKEAIRLATSNNRVDVSKYRSPRFHSRRTDSSCLLAEARLLACTSVARFRTSSSVGPRAAMNRTSSRFLKRRRGTQRCSRSLMRRFVIWGRSNW